MKTSIKTFIALAALSIATTGLLLAQERPFPPEGGPDGPGPRGPGGPGMGGHRPPPPLVGVLDANRDGIIDAEEIANASAALKKLDKNGDGKLTPDELRPPRPEGPGPDGPPPRE